MAHRCTQSDLIPAATDDVGVHQSGQSSSAAENPSRPPRDGTLFCVAPTRRDHRPCDVSELIARHSSDHAEPLQLLYDIERLTADALVPLMQHYQVAVSDDAADQEGRRLGAELVTRPWKSMWNEVIRLADDYLSDFNRLPDVLDEPYAAVGRQVVEHEEALIAFAHLEIADNPRGAGAAARLPAPLSIRRDTPHQRPLKGSS